MLGPSPSAAFAAASGAATATTTVRTRSSRAASVSIPPSAPPMPRPSSSPPPPLSSPPDADLDHHRQLRRRSTGGRDGGAENNHSGGVPTDEELGSSRRVSTRKRASREPPPYHDLDTDDHDDEDDDGGGDDDNNDHDYQEYAAPSSRNRTRSHGGAKRQRLDTFVSPPQPRRARPEPKYQAPPGYTDRDEELAHAGYSLRQRTPRPAPTALTPEMLASEARRQRDIRKHNGRDKAKQPLQEHERDLEYSVALAEVVAGGRRLTRNLAKGISVDPDLNSIAKVLEEDLPNIAQPTTTSPSIGVGEQSSVRRVPRIALRLTRSELPAHETGPLDEPVAHLGAPQGDDAGESQNNDVNGVQEDVANENGDCGSGGVEEDGHDGGNSEDPPANGSRLRDSRRKGDGDGDDDDDEYHESNADDDDDDDEAPEDEESEDGGDKRDDAFVETDSDERRRRSRRERDRRRRTSARKQAPASSAFRHSGSSGPKMLDSQPSYGDMNGFRRSLRPRRSGILYTTDDDNHDTAADRSSPAAHAADTDDDAGAADHDTAAAAAARSRSRSERAARRQARFAASHDGDHHGLDDDDTAPVPDGGVPSASVGGRRLRPRRTQVDYSRQLHPGHGWVGQPLEVLRADQHTSLNGRKRAAAAAASSVFARSGGGRRRAGDDDVIGPPTYRPGRGLGSFADHRQMDSDDDDTSGRRPSGSGGGGHGRPGGAATGVAEPLNIREILRAQEQAILRDLPEDERKKFEDEARLFRGSGGKDLADVDPLEVSNVSFDSVGGLEEHIRSLKEMVVMPLLYPEVFSAFRITAPRGVLFYGPPGTGKTLMARALAASCSTATQKVAFFMRKGADVLSKWVGESERQLRLLFEQAKSYQPSIIFFDEIDGLAPVRSSKQDQIHASIVSTLLALMDGLDSRGQVVVIGATNRVDALDPALRRPGRFDREFYFPLPPEPARRRIIDLATEHWAPPLPDALKAELATSTRGYCGADVKALCTEAALQAVRRQFPEIYDARHKLAIDVRDIAVGREDFAASMKKIIPSTERSSITHAKPMPAHVRALLSRGFTDTLTCLDILCPIIELASDSTSTTLSAPILESAAGTSASSSSASVAHYVRSIQPRVLICGEPGMGQRHIGPAALHALEARRFHIQSLDLAALLSESGRTADAAVVQTLAELRRHRPAALYLPAVDAWWRSVPDSAHAVLEGLLNADPARPLVLLATADSPFAELPTDLRQLFCGNFVDSIDRLERIEGWKRIIVLREPSESDKAEFFKGIIESVKQPPTVSAPTAMQLPARPAPLQRAPSPPPRKLTEAEVEALQEHAANLRRQLRMELRFIVNDIKRVKRFSDFHRPVDPDVYPDYYETVTRPMDLESLLARINNDEYAVLEEFVDDFGCILKSAEEFNEPGSAIVGKAMDLYDNCMMYVDVLKKREPEFIWELRQVALRCRLIDEQRKQNDLGEQTGMSRHRQPSATVANGQEQTPGPPDAMVVDLNTTPGSLPKKRPGTRRFLLDDDDDEDDGGVDNFDGNGGDDAGGGAADAAHVAPDLDVDIGAHGVAGGVSGETVAPADANHIEPEAGLCELRPALDPMDADPPPPPSPAGIDSAATATDPSQAPHNAADPPQHTPADDLPQLAGGGGSERGRSRTPASPPPPPPHPAVSVQLQATWDARSLAALDARLTRASRGMSVAELEMLAVALAAAALRRAADVDRAEMIK
ncbi:ATPase AAA domain-containing protein 2B, partial [Cladochytrium tenue]